MSVEELLRRGRIQAVEPDADVARAELDQAELHLESAVLLIETDPVLAHAAAYEAARKAVSAHMRARGFRVLGQQGQHAKLFEYAAAVLSDRLTPESLEHLDDMRGLRNDAAYRARSVGRPEVDADLGVARLVVAAVAASLRES